MDKNEHVELGKTYVDTVTGFHGVATAHCEFLNEEDQAQLENDLGHRWFTESRLTSEDA